MSFRVFLAVLTLASSLQIASAASSDASVERCLGISGGGNALTQEYRVWTRAEDRHEWRDAVRAGLPVVEEGFACVNRAGSGPALAEYALRPLQWAVLVGADAYKGGEDATMRMIGATYLPIAQHDASLTDDDFDRAAYKHAMLYLSDFRDGRCGLALCSGSEGI